MKTINVTLKYDGDGPPVTVTVPAWIVGAFAVHRDIVGLASPAKAEAKYGRGWTVTHIKTGLKAAFGIRVLAAARGIAQALLGVPGIDWNADDVPERLTPEIGAACLEAIAERRFA